MPTFDDLLQPFEGATDAEKRALAIRLNVLESMIRAPEKWLPSYGQWFPLFPTKNVVVNELGGDYNIRIESSGGDHMFFIDAGNNEILIDPSSTVTTADGTLHVHVSSAGTVDANASMNALVLEKATTTGLSLLTANDQNLYIAFGDEDDSYIGGFVYQHASDLLSVFAGNNYIMQFTGSTVTVNEDGDDVDFRVETSGNANMIVADGGSDVVAIGGAVDANYEFKVHGEVYKTSYTDLLAISDPGAPSASDVRLFASGLHLINVDENDLWHDLSAGAKSASSYIHTEVTISDENGLNIKWGAGLIYDALITGGNQMVTIVAQTVNQAMTASSMNYFYFDKSGGSIAYTIDPESDVDWAGGDFAIALVETSHDDILEINQFPTGNQELHSIREIIDDAFHAVVHSGLVVSAHSGDLTWDIDQSSGAFTHGGIDHHHVSSRSAPTMRRWFHNAANAWESDTSAQIDAANWDDDDDSSGVTGNDVSKYYRSTFHTCGDETHWVYPQVEYTTLNNALVGVDPTPPHLLQHLPKTTTLVMRGNAAGFPTAGSDQWIDVRPMLGGVGAGGAVTDHGNLAGLSDDDHTIYLLLAGETTDVNLHSGADLIVYSDAGSTEEMRIDGATGHIGIGQTPTASTGLTMTEAFTVPANTGSTINSSITQTLSEEAINIGTEVVITSVIEGSNYDLTGGAGLQGILFTPSWRGTGTCTNLTGYRFSPSSYTSGGTITNLHGFYIDSTAGSGTVTNNYGLYIENIVGDTLAYAIYTNAGSVHFGGALNVVGNITTDGTVDGIDIATDVAANTTHLSSIGTDHGYIDQDVTIGSGPAFTSATLTTPAIGVATGTSLDLGGTTLLASRALTVDTGGVFNIVLASAAGDDFTVDTDKLVVSGDTGAIGMGTAAPDALSLHVVGETVAAADATVIFGDDINAPTGANRTKVTIGNTDGTSEILIGQDDTHNFLFHWEYNATAANAFGTLESYGGNNALALQYTGGNVGIGKVPGSILDINLSTEDFAIVDAGSAGATEQDWIQVTVGGNTGYIRVYAAV